MEVEQRRAREEQMRILEEMRLVDEERSRAEMELNYIEE